MHLFKSITIFIYLVQIWSAEWLKFKANIGSLESNKHDLKLFEELILKIPENFVKIHDNSDFKITKNIILGIILIDASINIIMEKYSESKNSKCYEAMRNYTKDMYKGGYNQMLLSSFTDLADVGDYDRWKSLTEIATYNYLQMNLTYLPVNIRMGVWLPKQWDQSMMNSAGTAISNTLMNAMSLIQRYVDIWLIEEYYAGMEIRFYQPDDWAQKQIDEKGTTASYIVGIMICVIGISVIISVIKELIPQHLYLKRKMNEEKEILMSRNEEYVRNSTQANTIKFKQSSNNLGDEILSYETTEIPNFTNLREKKLIDNSFLDEGQAINYEHKNPKYKFLYKLAECFSIKKNLWSLAHSKRNNNDHEELDIIEGIKVLSMWWGLISCSALYLLIANLRNIMRMFKLFQLYLFPLI